MTASSSATLGTSRHLGPEDFSLAFADFLVSRGRLDQTAAERALQAQRHSSESIATVLSALGLVSSTELTAALSEFCGLPVIHPADFPLLPIDAGPISVDHLVSNKILPVARDDGVVTFAVSDPLQWQAVEALAYALDVRARLALANATDIDAAVRRLYDLASPLEGSLDAHNHSGSVTDDDLQRLKDIASEAPIVRLVTRLISSAAEQRASDIHIEPYADSLRVRFRIDGRAVEVDRLPLDMQAGIATRVKILSRLNIAERRLPQDGRIKVAVAGREIDLRVSTMPVLHGESIVLRLLDQSRVELSFHALGFDEETIQNFNELLASPNGIVLVTGPTGSGKTTTLYTALKQLNRVDRTIFSVEDPVEYQLSGINQVQIRPNIGLDFADCLRSILRQDPDTIMIGEMRDIDTVRIGIQASLTGHLVLSTVHTNSAVATIARLLDMGAEDYLLASTLAGVVAQRLVRRLCAHCSTDCSPSEIDCAALLAALPKELAQSLTPRVRRVVGCGKCNHTGYSGRTTIYELLRITPALRGLIKRGAAESALLATAQAEGMKTLYQTGVLKVLAGETTLAELAEAVRV